MIKLVLFFIIIIPKFLLAMGEGGNQDFIVMYKFDGKLISAEILNVSDKKIDLYGYIFNDYDSFKFEARLMFDGEIFRDSANNEFISGFNFSQNIYQKIPKRQFKSKETFLFSESIDSIFLYDEGMQMIMVSNENIKVQFSFSLFKDENGYFKQRYFSQWFDF